MPTYDSAQLLIQIEDLIRNAPPRATFRHDTDENFAWQGRAAALIAEWNPSKAITFEAHLRALGGNNAIETSNASRGIMLVVQEARHSLRLKAGVPLSVGIERGQVFDYFDEVRKVIETARSDLLFVDPYLDADFVSAYLPHVVGGVKVRLLGRKNLATLLPAVTLFKTQSNMTIEVRTCSELHDRFVFVDGARCLLSGASFKDGARLSPTTLTEIIDSFATIKATYEGLWQAGTPQL